MVYKEENINEKTAYIKVIIIKIDNGIPKSIPIKRQKANLNIYQISFLTL